MGAQGHEHLAQRLQEDFLLLSNMLLCCRNIQFHTKRRQQSAYGIKSRLGSRLQRFVKALSTQSGSCCNIGDAACFSNVTHGDQKCVLIGVFERSSKILGNGLFIVEIITGVE